MMAIKPLYEENLKQAGCGNTGCSIPAELMEKLSELEQKVDTQAADIQTLQKAFADKVDKSELITVHSLEDKALFKAFPLTTGEENGTN